MSRRVDVRAHNERAWDREVEMGSPWAQPVTSAQVEAARAGRWSVLLTNRTPVPASWFPPMEGLRVLALASGGGQQAPVLAAAGANVTVFDNSSRQLALDAMVAKRDGLALRIEQGDMADLSRFADASFDLVFNPASVLFVPDVRAVWREAHRVLCPGGTLLSGFLDPATFLFDHEKEMDGVLEVAHALPYADTDIPETRRAKLFGADAPLKFGHTLADLLGGQTAAGFAIVDLYEDRFGDGAVTDRYFAGLLATRAVKNVSPR